MGYSLPEIYWNRKNIDDEITKNGRIERSNKKTKTKQKKAKITWSSNFINMQEIHFLRQCCFLNSIFRMGEMPWEKKNRCQIKVENHRGIRLLNACCKLQGKILSKKLKAQAAMFLLECQNVFPKSRSCIDLLFSMKLIIEKGRELI